jgi:hypothetical protein
VVARRLTLIYEKAPTEDEREQILVSLRTIKENVETDGHEESNRQNSTKIKDFLMAAGTGTAAKIIAEWGKDLFNHFTSNGNHTMLP